MSSGNYPDGAANDRSAPFNQNHSEVECPMCDGTGETEVGHTEYISEKPYTKWVVDYTKTCTLCDGEKVVDFDTAADYNYDPDEEYERERDER